MITFVYLAARSLYRDVVVGLDVRRSRVHVGPRLAACLFEPSPCSVRKVSRVNLNVMRFPFTHNIYDIAQEQSDSPLKQI
jgi:hypothetical protein